MVQRPVSSLALALALVACGVPQEDTPSLDELLANAPEFPTAAEGIDLAAPPPAIGEEPLRIEVSEAVRGQNVDIVVTNGAPFGRVYVGGSAAGLGSSLCPPILDGLCLDILSPTLLATVNLDAAGSGSFSVFLPAGSPVSQIAVQAAQGVADGAAKSLPVLRTVRDAGTACYSLETVSGSTDPSRFVVEPQRFNPTTQWDAAKLLMRPVVIDGSGGGSVTVTATGGHDLWTAAGASLGTSETYADGALPVTVYVNGDAGPGAIELSSSGACDDQSYAAWGEKLGGLAGRELSAVPYFESVRTFHDNEAIEVAIDAGRFADRVGQTFTAHLVADRSTLDWATSPAFSSVSSVVGTVADTTVDGNVFTLSANPPDPARLSDDYDVIVDFDQNGRADPGDLISGLDGVGVTVITDLSAPGPYGFNREDRNFGTFREQRIYEPATNPPFDAPIVFISHGNGHDYRWYDYIGEHLASYGYVVMSHRDNTGPGPRSAAASIRDNMDLFLSQLGVYFTSTGGLPPVDDTALMNIGHSRGGDGVAIAYDDVHDTPSIVSQYVLSDVKLVSSIAPTVFYGISDSDPNDGNYHMIAGGADGDVDGSASCALCQYNRIPAYGTGRVQTTYVQGAGHNDFQEDGTWSDSTGPSLIGRAATLNLTKSYYLGLAEWYLRGNPAFEDLFSRGFDNFKPRTIAGNVEIAQAWIPNEGDGAQVVDDFQTNPATDTSASGGDVRFTVDNVREGRLDDNNSSYTWTTADPFNGMTEVSGDGFENGLVFDWTGHQYIEFDIPAGQRDVSGFDFFVMRAAQTTQHPTNTEEKSFGITLVDSQGRVSTIRPGWRDEITRTYLRSSGWTNEFNTVRARLTDFLRDGNELDLSDIVRVRLEFGPYFGSEDGRLGIDDLFFVNENVTPN